MSAITTNHTAWGSNESAYEPCIYWLYVYKNITTMVVDVDAEDYDRCKIMKMTDTVGSTIGLSTSLE